MSNLHFSSAESEWNTPEWLYTKVIEFFGEAPALDPAWNPESHVEATVRYGRLTDGTFIDALGLEEWEAPGSATCYLNPPGGLLVDGSSRQAAFVEKLEDEVFKGKYAERPFQEPVSPDSLFFCISFLPGRIKTALVLLPISFRKKWFQRLVLKYPACFIFETIKFELTTFAANQRETSLSDKGDPQGRVMFLIFLGGRGGPEVEAEVVVEGDLVDRFGQVFSSLGYVAGFNGWSYRAN